jgi:DNA polymerase III subunit delta
MQLRPDQLDKHLASDLKPIYWIHGNETLVVLECQETLRRHCRDKGILERDVYHVDNPNQFNWDTLADANASLSLFGDRKIIELRLNGNKIGDQGSKALQAYADNANPDNVLIISSSRLEKAQHNSKYFKTVQAIGATIQVYDISSDDLPAWLSTRAGARGLHLTADACRLMADRVQGNLLAAAQEVDKLLMAGHTHIDADTASALVADSARFSVFAMVDAAMAGDSKCLTILEYLRAEGNDAVSTVMALAREIRIGLEIMEGLARGQRLDGLMRNLHLWSSKTPIYQRFSQRMNVRKAARLLQQCKEVEHMSKGMADGDPWVGIGRIMLNMCR